MIKLIKIKDPSLKWGFLSQFHPEDSVFIVSDIKTKQAVETELLKNLSFLPGSCVLRANEFYKQIFYSLNLDWNLCSDNFIKGLFSEFCLNQQSLWFKNLKGSQSLFDFFNVFLMVLIHQNHSSLFEEWLKEKNKPSSWLAWFKLSKDFFNFLKSKKIIHESGVKALLLDLMSSIDKNLFNKNKIFVDLAFSLDLCEREIFKELSRQKEVFILYPELKKNFMFGENFDIYQQWEKELLKDQIDSIDSYLKKDVFQSKEGPRDGHLKINSLVKKSKKEIFRQNRYRIKSETQLEELRKAVAQVCRWLKAGVSPQNIAILAPSMEKYWFALKIYLEKEGIPVKKSIVSKLIAFPEVQYFLSALRLHLGYFKFEDLESFCFYKESKKEFSFFKSMYFKAPDRDLAKKLLFKHKVKYPESCITGHEFIEWALSFWPNHGQANLLESILGVFKNFPMEEQLTASSWLGFFESELLSQEIDIKEEDSWGISCLSFNALDSIKSPYVFILDLNEESLRDSPLAFFNESDGEDILNDLGFSLSFKPPQKREKSLLWFLQSSHYKELYLSRSSYNFKGEIQTGGWIYLLSDVLLQVQETDILESLSWDHNRKQDGASQTLELTARNKIKAKKLEQALKNPGQTFFHTKKIELSASRMKTYTNCPFKYAGEKLFFVKDQKLMDREFSEVLQGSIVHNLFEKILKFYPELNLTEEQINIIVEEMKPKAEHLIYKKQWLLIKEYLINLTQAFIQKEQADRKIFPHLKPVAFEKEYISFWNQKRGELSSQGDYVFKGYVDRIDKDETLKACSRSAGREIKSSVYVLRDYKASKNKLTHISSWLKPHQEEFQLTFYAQALEKGFIPELPAFPVEALFYSVYNDNFSAKGFVKKGSYLENIMGNARQHKKEKKDLYKAIDNANKQTQKIIQKMEKGQFMPQPKDKKLCGACAYQTWCRVEVIEGLE